MNHAQAADISANDHPATVIAQLAALRVRIDELANALLRLFPDDIREGDAVDNAVRLLELFATVDTTPKRIRNEAAVCGNCPHYCASTHHENCGYCQRLPLQESCGQHPDFWILPK